MNALFDFDILYNVYRDVIIVMYIHSLLSITFPQVQDEEDDHGPPARDNISWRSEQGLPETRDHRPVDTGAVRGS